MWAPLRKCANVTSASPLRVADEAFPIPESCVGQPGPRRAEANRRGRKQTLEEAGLEVFAAIVPGDAEQVVARAAQEQGIVPLVKGAYATRRCAWTFATPQPPWIG